MPVTTLTTSDSALQTIEADALVVFSAKSAQGAPEGTQEKAPQVLSKLPKKTRTWIAQRLERLHGTGGAGDVVTLLDAPGVAAPVVVVTGVGDADASPEAVRRAAGAAVRSLAGTAKVAIAPPAGDDLAVAAAEGAAFGAYRFDRHLSDARRDAAASAPVKKIVVAGEGLAEGVERAGVLAQEQAWARDLVNTSPNVLFPASFADDVRAHAPKGVKIEVLDENELVKGGFGGIVGVGQGSVHPPRLVTMTYTPKKKARASLAFVGKGITFDSGGLCIKPAGSMITMKCDMGGAAAVAGAVCAIARLGLPVEVRGYLCLAENMPGNDAQRPGDVVTMRDGQTVEIINTDAEGRLVMADGIALAAERHPDAIVDVATLTGAAMIALGKRTAAVMANDDELQGDLTTAATTAGESVWPLPIAEEIRSGMDSLVADFKHTGDREGGAMVAAAFLREFAGRDADGRATSWGHLDIAGPAYNEGSAHGYTPKGGTGYGVRTLVAFAESRA